MKRILFFFIAFTVAGFITAQNRHIARGADPGELYLTSNWYGTYAWGPGFYDTLRTAIYRLTENGKKLTIQYDDDYFATDYPIPDSIKLPARILADATPGVVYLGCPYSKDHYSHTSLWVSFDYGKNWTFREGIIGMKSYFSANSDGIIYRGGSGEVYKSTDYGQLFIKEDNLKFIGKEPGLEEKEVFYAAAEYYNGVLTHTYDYFETYTQIPIDSQYMFGSLSGRFPDVYRGGLPSEVYITSWFPDLSYKVSFSADTGQTFRHVYIYSDYQYDESYPTFMSDREPGVFYLVWGYSMEDFDPWGHHLKLCVEHYKDYGETLVGVYCHDLTKDYGKTCEAVTDLSSAPCGADCVLLTWSEPESGLPVEGYRVYRNEELLNDELLIETSYLDENLPSGEYEYYVVAHYEMECVADESNRVIETIGGEICDDVITLTSEIVNQNAVQLHWTHSADDLLIEGYHVFRNQSLITNKLLEDTTYTDEDLSNGTYQYFVVAYFTNDCDSIVSNVVEETIEVVGIEAFPIPSEGDVRVYPNPTGGELQVTSYGLQVTGVEVFDLMGRKVLSQKAESGKQKAEGGKQKDIDISHLPSGMYFVRVTTETGVVVKKVVKR